MRLCGPAFHERLLDSDSPARGGMRAFSRTTLRNWWRRIVLPGVRFEWPLHWPNGGLGLTPGYEREVCDIFGPPGPKLSHSSFKPACHEPILVLGPFYPSELPRPSDPRGGCDVLGRGTCHMAPGKSRGRSHRPSRRTPHRSDELIPALVNGQEARWVRGVTDREIEVDHAVEFAAGSDEGVQGLALRLAFGGVIKCAFKGRQRRADDLEARGTERGRSIDDIPESIVRRSPPATGLRPRIRCR